MKMKGINMTIANSIKEDLDQMGIHYDVVDHPQSDSSRGSAYSAHIPAEQLAKGVVLKDEQGYVLAVLPATRNLNLKTLEDHLGRRLELEDEQVLPKLFPDCKLGAVPAIGSAYDMDTIVDKSLLSASEIYFESGDHEKLIHIKEGEFEKLMQGAKYDRFSMRDEL